MCEYTRENYEAYCEMFRTEPEYEGLLPSSYEHWVAFNTAMDDIQANERLQQILDDPRMADDYSWEKSVRDGVPYWRRNAD